MPLTHYALPRFYDGLERLHCLDQVIERGVFVSDMLDCENEEIMDLLDNHKRIRARYLLKRWRIRLIARNFWLYWYFRAVDRVYAPGMPGHEETMAALEEIDMGYHDRDEN